MAPERFCSSRMIAFTLFSTPQAERQPGVDPGGLLPDQPCPQHQPVRDDLGFLRGFPKARHEIAAETHERLSVRAEGRRAHNTDRP
jgi:hypothetical protein